MEQVNILKTDLLNRFGSDLWMLKKLLMQILFNNYIYFIFYIISKRSLNTVHILTKKLSGEVK